MERKKEKQRENKPAANSSQTTLDAQMQYCRELSSAIKATIDIINNNYKRRINAEYNGIK